MTKIWVKTFGCSSNFSDGEVIAGLLKKAGFELVSDIDDAYLAIINCCTVRGNVTTLRSFRKIVEEYPYKRIILAGCVTESLIEESRAIKEDISTISTHNMHNIVSVVEETMHDNFIDEIEVPKECKEKINLPRIRKNPRISIIPISKGCVSACAYCSVRLVKGKLLSYPIESILEEAKQAVEDGCRELWITSQDTASYGMDWDKNSHLPELLKAILAIKGEFSIRLGMGNPQHFMMIIDELLEIMKHRKMFKFLHIPIQSGNDEVLKSMKRRYTREDFFDLIDKIREHIPKITIATDIICGYPEETDAQFKDSLAAMERIKPDILNIAKFQARENTAAMKMKQVDGAIIKDRSREVTSQFDWIAYARNRKWKGWTGKVLVDEESKDGTWVGRNSSYKPVILKGNYKLGDIVDVTISDVTKYDLRVA